MGPYNSPLPLAKEFWSSMAWVICGFTVFSVLIFGLANAISPETFYDADGNKSESFYWGVNLVGAIAAGLLIFAMTEWSNWIGAGYFAGYLKADRGWFLLAVFASPVIWISLSMAMNAIMGGGNWVYIDEESTEYARAASVTMSGILYAVLLAPILEELSYRGIGMGAVLARGWHPYLAVGVMSALFAATHMQYSPAAMFVVFVGGIWFGALRIMSGSVGVAIAAHISINATLTLLQA